MTPVKSQDAEDRALREALAPLRAAQPRPGSAGRAVAAARIPLRARLRALPVAAAAAAAATAVAVAVLPTVQDERSVTADARGVLLAAARTAENRLVTAAPAPVRFTEVEEVLTFPLVRPGAEGDRARATATVRRERLAWASHDDALREEVGPARRTFAGDPELRGRLAGAAWSGDGPHVLESDDTRGDGPLANDRPRDLPADPAAVRRRFERAIAADSFAPGNRPSAAEIRGMVAMSVLVRLAHAYTTPQSRGTLFRVLAGIPEVRSLGGVELADGRRGQAVEIPPAAEAGARPDSWRGEQRVVFDTRTAEVLEWRSPGESYTFWPRDLARLPRAERAAAGEVTRGVVWRTLVFRRAAGVERIGERP